MAAGVEGLVCMRQAAGSTHCQNAHDKVRGIQGGGDALERVGSIARRGGVVRRIRRTLSEERCPDPRGRRLPAIGSAASTGPSRADAATCTQTHTQTLARILGWGGDSVRQGEHTRGKQETRKNTRGGGNCDPEIKNASERNP